jgi:mevalonate kinase
MLYSCPGKVFLLGEYAALHAAPSVVATVGPRFELMELASDGKPSSKTFAQGWAPASPVGRLLRWAEQRLVPMQDYQFKDPHEGAGGFGASTAQFALTYLAIQQSGGRAQNWAEIWGLYRELHADKKLPPSGADLVAQWQGGVTLFEPSERRCEDIFLSLDWSKFLVFSAASQPGRKVATHTHLEELDLSKIPFETLYDIIEGSLEAIHEHSIIRFASSMSAYASVLSAVGFEDPRAKADREALSSMAGVLAVKGAGAMLADAVVVVMDPQARASQRADVASAAGARGLSLISDGITHQSGVLCREK